MGKREEKAQVVKELSQKLKENSSVIVTEYQGLTVADLSDLRAKLRAQKAEYTVVKNTLGKIVLKDTGLGSLSEFFRGPIAIAVQKGDPVAGAKALVDFAKDHAKLKIKAGLLGDKVLTSDEVKALAALPSHQVLVGKLLGTLQGPVYGLVNVMQGTIRKAVYALDAVRKQKEAA